MVIHLAIDLMVTYEGCIAVNHVKILSKRNIVLEVQWPTLKLLEVALLRFKQYGLHGKFIRVAGRLPLGE